jgi:hypothetical protein
VLPILIPTTAIGTPTALALTMEGLVVTEVKMNDYYHYGRMFTEQWQTGKGFILVEHDVVPWPGALGQMNKCQEELCAFEYPSSPDSTARSLGCTKFSTSLVQRVPYNLEWQSKGWDQLDGAVFETLQDVNIHLHRPMVAHAKARYLTLSQT